MNTVYEGAVRVQDKSGRNVIFLGDRRVAERRTGLDRRLSRATPELERRIEERRIASRRTDSL